MSLIALTPTRLLVVGAVLPLAAVGTALVTQHVFGMQPCPWCVLQRLIFVAISLVALLGLAGQLTRLLIVRRVGAMGLLAVSGIAAALWQHFVASSSTSCELTLADRIITGLGVDAHEKQNVPHCEKPRLDRFSANAGRRQVPGMLSGRRSSRPMPAAQTPPPSCWACPTSSTA